jgi:hypothetical protein
MQHRRLPQRVQGRPALAAGRRPVIVVDERRRWTDVFPVTPATLLARHHKFAGSKYDTSKRRKPGRPPMLPSIGGLVVRLAFAWQRRIRCGDTAGSMASWRSSA